MANQTTQETNITNAEEALAKLQATTAAAAAVQAELTKRILRAAAEITELGTLTNGSTGTLDIEKTRRTAEVSDYAPIFNAATSAVTTTADAVKARSSGSATDGGALTEAMEVAKAAYNAKVALQTTAQNNLDAKLTAAGALAALRKAVVDDTAAWNAQELLLVAAALKVTNQEGTVAAAQMALDKAVADCQVLAYDKYRETLEAEMVQRAADLKKIKELLEAGEAAKPAPGKAGARCEKALSNGTWRPKRGEQTCDEGLCCGAARIWMDAGAGPNAVDAAWRTVETCQSEEA